MYADVADINCCYTGADAMNGNQTLSNFFRGNRRRPLFIRADPFCGQESITLERRLRPG